MFLLHSFSFLQGCPLFVLFPPRPLCFFPFADFFLVLQGLGTGPFLNELVRLRCVVLAMLYFVVDDKGCKGDHGEGAQDGAGNVIARNDEEVP